MASTLSFPLRVVLIQFLGCEDSLEIVLRFLIFGSFPYVLLWSLPIQKSFWSLNLAYWGQTNLDLERNNTLNYDREDPSVCVLVSKPLPAHFTNLFVALRNASI